jgi:hypothetical protein
MMTPSKNPRINPGRPYRLKASWVLLLIFLSIPINAQEKLTPFEQAEKWGYRNVGGKVVIHPRFSLANEFSPEGIAAVVDEQGWAYIDDRGNILIRPFIVDNGPDYFQNGLARFVEFGNFGFFNQKARVKLEGQWMAIDRKGKSIMDENRAGAIGAAWKEEDGTIVLQLRAESPGGARGDALLRYPPGHRQYQEILQHLGGLEIGQKKPVPPWPAKD